MKPARFLLLATGVILAICVFVVYPQRERREADVANQPTQPRVNSLALLARHYPSAPQKPREEVTIVRTADGFEPRFGGKIEPQINVPGSRWKNPAKAVLPKFPKHFNNPMSVSSTFDRPRGTGVPPVSSATGQTPAPSQITYSATALPLNASTSSVGEVAPDGTLVYRDAFGPGIDAIYRVQALKTEEFIVIRERESGADTLVGELTNAGTRVSPPLREFSWQLGLGEGEAALKPRLTPMHTVELCDDKGVPRLRIDLPEGKDADGKRLTAGKELCYAIDGSRLTLAADLGGAKFPVVIDPSWSSTGQMSVNRGYHTMTKLFNGKFLVTGGLQSQQAPVHAPGAEVYDPDSGTWASTTNAPLKLRMQHCAALLPDGKVLIIGGHVSQFPSGISLSDCEIFDPDESTWTAANPMTYARVSATLTTLDDGKILVAGGTTSLFAEVFNPSTGSWSSTQQMMFEQRYSTATVLTDGRVLHAGGLSNTNSGKSCQVFRPSTNDWVSFPTLTIARESEAASFLMPNNTVLVIGGYLFNNNCESHSFDTGEWAEVSPLTIARAYAKATRLPQGSILLIGGLKAYGSTETCEIMKAGLGTWELTSPLSTSRYAHQISSLNNGTVLVSGGMWDVPNQFQVYLKSVEIFDPSPTSHGAVFTIHHTQSQDVNLIADSVVTSLQYEIVDSPAHGGLSGAIPNLKYTPTSGYTGNDSFTFKTYDGTFYSNIATITIGVTDTAPVSDNQTVSTHFNTDVAIALAASDGDDDPLTFSIVTPPANGTLSGTNPNLTYTPNLNFVGSDSFTFKTNDGALDSNVATVSITVADTAPVSNNQTVSTHFNTDLAIMLAASDADNDPLTYSIVAPPTNGTLSGTIPNLTYTPDVNFAGSDSFTFKTSDGARDSNVATVNITVTDTAPLSNNQTVSTHFNTDLAIVLAASDADNDPLTYSIVAPPGNGTLSGTIPNLTYTPDVNFVGSDSFTFKTSDGALNSNVATVIITVTDTAPVSNNQTVSTHFNTDVAIVLTASDTDNDPITYSFVTSNANGTLSGTIPYLTYTPGLNFVGSDSFTYKTSDGALDSNVATVNITVTDTGPVSNNQTVSTHFNTDVAIVLAASDANNDPLTFSIVTPPANGTLSGTIPNLTYTPAVNFLGSDLFTFKVKDGLLDSNIAEVNITVTNTAPLVQVSAFPTVVVPGEFVSFFAFGVDSDGDPITYSWNFYDSNSSTEQNPVHAFSQTGTYLVTATVIDSIGATGTASISIIVSKAPTVRITTDDVVGFSTLPLVFDATLSTDPENQIASYSWDFGDGSPLGSQQIMSKIFDQPGTYTVTLTVTDAAGVSSSLQRIIEVLPADQAGLFNGFVSYKVRWDRDKESKDTLQLTAQVNVGEQVVGAGTLVALDIVGQHFEGTLDLKLRDKTDPDDVWQVKANLRNQPVGTVLLKVKIKNADLGLGFNQAGAVKGADANDLVDASIPVRITVGARSFELNVGSEFKFNSSGKRAKGEGDE